mmetsp:Transcript_8162/g.20531  ORF Transcript_8162/g.20531 Transcript_8162/m.20531 type:complete len:277 (-) Transcript_8162:964-1794(-)
MDGVEDGTTDRLGVILGTSLGSLERDGTSDGESEGTLLGEEDGTCDGVSLGKRDGTSDGSSEGDSLGDVVGKSVGVMDGAGEGAAVGTPHMHGSPMAAATAVWTSRHSILVNSLSLPRASNSPHWTPPTASVSNVGSPLKQAVQKTFGSPTEGAELVVAPGTDGEPAGDGVVSLGHPHVSRANAWAIPHCSMVKPGPKGPPIAWATPQVTPIPIDPNPNNNAPELVRSPPSRQMLQGNLSAVVGAGVGGTGAGVAGTTGAGVGAGDGGMHPQTSSS